mmetsp:Transcript_14225/g.30172  ORF Transcript_14225/g.30172 Transcript_14225/m.30172 type:complete len:237 (-) Transcript_14225:559-1269(-)
MIVTTKCRMIQFQYHHLVRCGEALAIRIIPNLTTKHKNDRFSIAPLPCRSRKTEQPRGHLIHRLPDGTFVSFRTDVQHLDGIQNSRLFPQGGQFVLRNPRNINFRFTAQSVELSVHSHELLIPTFLAQIVGFRPLEVPVCSRNFQSFHRVMRRGIIVLVRESTGNVDGGSDNLGIYIATFRSEDGTLGDLDVGKVGHVENCDVIEGSVVGVVAAHEVHLGVAEGNGGAVRCKVLVG